MRASAHPVAFCALWLFLATVAVTTTVFAGELVPFERTDAGDRSMVDVFRKHYDDPEANDSSYLEFSRWNAFRTFQDALIEMMVDPATSQRNRESFRQFPSISDDIMGPMPMGWRHTYWNRGMPGAPEPLADASGNVSRSHIFSEDIDLENKNFYMPDVETLDKLLEIMNKQDELGKPILPNAMTVPEEYETEARKLEEAFIQAVANELNKVRQAIKDGEKIFGLGFVTDENGNLKPLELNIDMIEEQMRRLGLDIPEAEDEATDENGREATSAAAVANSPPIVQVRQPRETVQKLESDYEEFLEMGLSESERTRREIELDMFRVRATKEVGGGVKSYDLVGTPEYQTGGLNLPSHLPAEE